MKGQLSTLYHCYSADVRRDGLYLRLSTSLVSAMWTDWRGGGNYSLGKRSSDESEYVKLRPRWRRRCSSGHRRSPLWVGAQMQFRPPTIVPVMEAAWRRIMRSILYCSHRCVLEQFVSEQDYEIDIVFFFFTDRIGGHGRRQIIVSQNIVVS
jgi:hypothetical protein